MPTLLSASSQSWLDRVLARFGIPDSQRHDCIARAAIVLDQVVILFVPPQSGEAGHLVARAVVGDVPPQGQCEALYQLVLEVQALLSGAHTPVLGLDWPARRLLVSCSMEMHNLGADDAAGILRSMQQVAMQWREAIAKMTAAPPNGGPQSSIRDSPNHVGASVIGGG